MNNSDVFRSSFRFDTLDDISRMEMQEEIENMLWNIVDGCIQYSCTFRKDKHRSEINFVLQCLFKAATDIVNLNSLSMNEQFMKKDLKQYLGPTPLPRPNISNFSVYVEPDDDDEDDDNDDNNDEYYDIEEEEE